MEVLSGRIKTITIYTIVILYPYLFLRLGDANITALDVSIIAAFLFIVARRERLQLRPKIFYISACVFILASAVPLYFYGESISILLQTLQIAFVLIFMFPIVNSLLNIKTYIKATKLACILWSLFLICNIPLLDNPSNYQHARFIGLYGSPLNMGLITALVFPYLLEFSTKEDNIYATIMLLVALTLSLVYIQASGSRAPLVGLAVGVSAYLILKYNSVVKMILTVAASALIVSVFLRYSNRMVKRNAVHRLISAEDIRDRIKNLKYGLPNEPSVLILGVGYGNSKASGTLPKNISRPHNIFISSLRESGVLGLISMTLILYCCIGVGLSRLFKRYMRGIRSNGIIIATYSSAIVLFVSQQVSSLTNHRGFWLVYAVCLWMSYKRWKRIDKANRV